MAESAMILFKTPGEVFFIFHRRSQEPSIDIDKVKIDFAWESPYNANVPVAQVEGILRTTVEHRSDWDIDRTTIMEAIR